jgi:hypothetical protein
MEDGVPESLKERVYYAARDGLAITLFALLAETPNPEKLLAEVTIRFFDSEIMSLSPRSCFVLGAKFGSF